ncbi:MAG TPA: response regulator [Sedimentisphaerales bacterium]|nr:response regulator [Sedimentisphaerales bacterium]HRS13319.1 response regulator [Sedimentisphaerales bacterium]HRV49970.1 response regulator [Sedimentisphaerales bacterium]
MPHLLIVDDDPDFVEAIQIHLERCGHSAESASDRTEGMRLARGGRFDLLILDVMMAEPDDGIVMAQQLRKEGFDKPILMLSGISTVAGMRYGQDKEVLPASDFLEKPVRPETLIAKVHALLNP